MKSLLLKTGLSVVFIKPLIIDYYVNHYRPKYFNNFFRIGDALLLQALYFVLNSSATLYYHYNNQSASYLQ